MTQHDIAASADAAIEVLRSAPDLSATGVKLVSIVSDAQAGFRGFKIPLSVEAQHAIASIAQTVRERLQDSTLIHYGPAVLIPPQYWMHISPGDAAVLENIETIVGETDLDSFAGKAATTGAVRLIAARITTKAGTVVTFYRVADPMLQLKKSKVLALLVSGGVYDRLEATDALFIQPNFDVVVVGGYAFFSKKPTFERAFGFLAELKKQSLATFTTVTNNLRVKGLNEFQAACTSQPQMMAKMSSIKRSMDHDPDYAKAMTMKKLLRYIEDHPHVDIEMVSEGGKKVLVFDSSPKRRFQILKLLDDDFLHSVLTARDYEAGSKVRTVK